MIQPNQICVGAVPQAPNGKLVSSSQIIDCVKLASHRGGSFLFLLLLFRPGSIFDHPSGSTLSLTFQETQRAHIKDGIGEIILE